MHRCCWTRHYWTVDWDCLVALSSWVLRGEAGFGVHFLKPCCVQVLELICTRESGAVFEAGGLNCVLSFIRDSGHLVHKDTLHSAMAVVSRLCSKMEPQDSSLETCVESLSSLLKHEDHQVTKHWLF